MTLYYLPNARAADQREEMVRREEQGVCIFCPGHLGSPGGKTIYFSNETWSCAQNDYPYEGTETHVMLIPRDHVVNMAELSKEAMEGFWDILRKTQDHFGYDHFVLAARNGNPAHTGATIKHLHVHVIVSDPGYTEEPIVFVANSVKPTSPPPE